MMLAQTQYSVLVRYLKSIQAPKRTITNTHYTIQLVSLPVSELFLQTQRVLVRLGLAGRLGLAESALCAVANGFGRVGNALRGSWVLTSC